MRVYQFRHPSVPYTSGAEGSRTPDLLNAIQALSQLSYSPALRCTIRDARSDRHATPTSRISCIVHSCISCIVHSRIAHLHMPAPRFSNTSSHPTGLTGLEPAASGVTDRHSNRLSYSPFPIHTIQDSPCTSGGKAPSCTHASCTHAFCSLQSGRPDSNRRPSAWQADALPTELRPHSCASAPTGNRTPITSLKGWRPSR
jgi:hypothetical protein